MEYANLGALIVKMIKPPKTFFFLRYISDQRVYHICIALT